MSGNQLIIPEQDREDDAIVQRQQYIDVSREIVPEVQVSLAKRIITPNSNKVLCLAAQTSVPVVDDETASVSNLALRLADGTNVRLSLSYFNDLPANNCIPLTRNIYDPNRYIVKSESTLGKVFVTFAVAALAGLMCMANKPNNIFYPLLHWNSPSLASSQAGIPGSVSKEHKLTRASKPASNAGPKTAKATKVQKITAKAPAKLSAPNLVGPPAQKAPVILAGRAPARAPRISRRASSSGQSRAPRSYAMDRDSMLVPPPPPVMMLNMQPDMNMARYIPELMGAGAPQMMFPKTSHKAASKPKQLRLPPPPDPVSSYMLAAPPRAPQFQLPPVADTSMMQQQEVVMRPKTTHIKRVEILSAPVPGHDPNYPPLERIQYPAPDAASQ